MIQLEGALVVALHLGLKSVLQNLPSTGEGFHAHGHIVSTRFCEGQKYESSEGAGEEPVLCAGPGGRATAEEVEISAANGENSLVPSWLRHLAKTTSFNEGAS